MSTSTSSSGEQRNGSSTDYFNPPHNSKLNPLISKEAKQSKSSSQTLDSSTDHTTLMKEMSAIPNEHDFPGLPVGAEAPGARPTSKDLEYVRARPWRSSSMKSMQQIQREGTLSNARSYLGLIPEAPIIEGYACFLYFAC